nr:hypothetical protein [Tanacetum cinerariifolium]
ELPQADMKEILHQRMFESGSYKSLPEHVALYEALEASMERAQRDEFLAEKDKSRKRRRDDQDHPSPLPESYLSKRRRHDPNASGSSQPQALQSSAWKKALMKNLEDAYAIGDQFINDKSTEYESKKPNVEAKVVSMVTVSIYQASFSVPPLSTPIPVIDLSLPKIASSATQAPIFTKTTTTTTTTVPPPHNNKAQLNQS